MKPETIERIRFWMGRKLPRWAFVIAVFVRHVYKKIRMPESKKSFGDMYPDKIFYVIRLFPPATGFLANYNYVLGYMHYAYSKGWIPVVDMENYGTLYQEKEAINGTRNVWEYFFEQPLDPETNTRYSLADVYRSKNVILAEADAEGMYCSPLDEKNIEWQIQMSKLVPFKPEIQSLIDEVLQRVLPKNENILGIPTRGSEQKKRVIGHPIPLSIEELLPIIKQKYIDWAVDGVFIKAEEEETIKWLSEVLPKIYYTDCSRIKKYKDIMPASNANIAVSKYQGLLDYLTDIYIISKCSCLIGTVNNGLYTAIIWNKKSFNHIEVIDNGLWK